MKGCGSPDCPTKRAEFGKLITICAGDFSQRP
jgi:hypothetical protein